MNKEIVFITNTMSRGGAARVLSILANHYAKKEWKVGIILRKIENTYQLNPNITIIEVGNDSQTNRFKWISIIRNYVKKREGCIVVSFLSMVNVYTILATRGLKARVIVSERNDIKIANAGFKYYLARYMYSKADHIVFQSNRVKNYFSSKVQKKSTIILNPVKISCKATAVPANKIVNSGRLEPQKNQKLLIIAFSKLVKIHPEYKLYIYGEGTLRGELLHLVDGLGLNGKVFLPGNVSDIHEKIADAKMFVLSSNFEGLSNSLLESMMMGLPCISTECAGSDEIIRSGENGLLVAVGDETALFTAMERLIEDSELCRKIAKNAMDDADQFRYENVIRKWEFVFEQ